MDTAIMRNSVTFNWYGNGSVLSSIKLLLLVLLLLANSDQ